jgi:hypothetical protein
MFTYPANLCPLFGWAELAGFGEDFGQPIGKAVETASRRAVRQGSTEHLDCVLREEQRVNNAVYASAWRDDRRLRVSAASTASLRTAVIRTLMLTDPSPRASSTTRQALTVALVKPGRGSSSYQAKNSSSPRL